MKTAVPAHPKTRALAVELGIRLSEAVGILSILWGYARQHAKDGDLSSLTPKRLALLLDWPTADGDRLYAALQESGWVDPHPYNDGAFIVHDWLQHCEAYILRDLAAAGRVSEEKPRETPISELYRPIPQNMQCMQNEQNKHDMLGSPPSSPSTSPSTSSPPTPPASHPPQASTQEPAVAGGGGVKSSRAEGRAELKAAAKRIGGAALAFVDAFPTICTAAGWSEASLRQIHEAAGKFGLTADDTSRIMDRLQQSDRKYPTPKPVEVKSAMKDHFNAKTRGGVA